MVRLSSINEFPDDDLDAASARDTIKVVAERCPSCGSPGGLIGSTTQYATCMECGATTKLKEILS